jgi:hypothetical protein
MYFDRYVFFVFLSMIFLFVKPIYPDFPVPGGLTIGCLGFAELAVEYLVVEQAD